MTVSLTCQGCSRVNRRDWLQPGGGCISTIVATEHLRFFSSLIHCKARFGAWPKVRGGHWRVPIPQSRPGSVNGSALYSIIFSLHGVGFTATNKGRVMKGRVMLVIETMA